jgi:hypothetical protein
LDVGGKLEVSDHAAKADSVRNSEVRNVGRVRLFVGRVVETVLVGCLEVLIDVALVVNMAGSRVSV